MKVYKFPVQPRIYMEKLSQESKQRMRKFKLYYMGKGVLWGFLTASALWVLVLGIIYLL